MADGAAELEAPACPAPVLEQHGPTRYRVPTGAVDCHAHVIGLPPRYPLKAQRSYTPPAAPPSAYIAMLDATGMAYGVLVQVSVHGTDNRILLEALAAYPSRLKGVAVVDPDSDSKALAALKDAGVVGLRIDVLYTRNGVGFDAIERYNAICREMGWHIQFLVDAKVLPELTPRLRRIDVPLVFDHWGHFPVSRGLHDEGFQTLLALLRDGAWAKLSGAYRNSVAGFPYFDTIPFARAVHEAAPDRCVWGSDWPNVANWKHMMNIGDLLDLLADWVPDDSARARVFVDNAYRLYGFPGGPQHIS